jgi:hypothetical protein
VSELSELSELRGREAEEEEGGYRTKNKNPTRQCGEKTVQLMPACAFLRQSSLHMICACNARAGSKIRRGSSDSCHLRSSLRARGQTHLHCFAWHFISLRHLDVFDCPGCA